MRLHLRFAALFCLASLIWHAGSWAQDSTGQIVVWGIDDYDQWSVPEPNSDFVTIAGGAHHCMALKEYGSIVAWGGNPWGQCDVPEPNADFIAMSGHGDDCLGLKADRSLVSWGNNYYGQSDIPPPNSGFVAICACGNHNLALRADGSVAAWGYNEHGESNVPSPNTDFVAVAGGPFHSLGLKSDGSIVAWGYNNHGQCDVPQPNADFVAIEAGTYHNLALKSDGSIVAWGWNDYGQCSVPLPNVGFVAVAGGYYHSLGLASDGSIVTWGSNDHGQCDVPSPNTGFTAVAAGAYHSMATRGGPPVLTYLASFTAERRDSEALVRWAIVQPVAGVVFRLWRQEPGRERVRLSHALLGSQTAYDFTDPAPPNGSADYWLQEVETNGSANWYGPAHLDAAIIPSALRLYAAAPNPFNPRTTIRFDLREPGAVRLAIYDIAGRLLKVLVGGEMAAGSHEAVWDGRGASGRAMASGSYFARLEAGGKVEAVRMSLVR